MDWIEQLFGVSPDGGDGSTEALIVGAFCLVLVVLIAARYRQVLLRVLRGQ